MTEAPHFQLALDYAKKISEDPGQHELMRLGCRRFLDDLESPKYDFRPALAEFCIELMIGLFAFSQGERMDGTPLRGVPFELMPWHLYCTYAICGFYWAGTDLRRFTEADIFAPRKTVKTTWAEALQTCLALWYRKSGSKAKTVAGSLKQGMEGFDWLVYNFTQLGLVEDGNPEGKLQLLNSSLGHSIKGEIWGGSINLETFAFKPELFDAFNANLVHLDELELYKDSRPYTRLKDAMKAYSNKLILCTFTAGDDGTGFAAQHHDYMAKILRGTITGPAADKTFVFMSEAERDIDGAVDYTNPAIHRMANPAYGITIRPDDMLAAALAAKENPSLRKEFFTRSLNLFVNSYKAWFNVDEFRRSDARYNWTLPELARLCKSWFGGADLSKLHDLTAAAIVGEIPAAKAATAEWAPPEDVLIIIPHCWFPITAAAEKANQDNIPLFGWQEDGWLDMPNEASMDPTEPVKQFKQWRDVDGFKIKKVGHDRKFARKYYSAMKAAGFTVVDQPQLYVQKSEGFRYIEHKAKIGCLYYLHAEPYEYCISNVRAQEKVDDAVQYEKLSPTSRIDIFDASVFATVRMLIDADKIAASDRWFGKKEE
nr:MAG TPA_asm: Large Terminase [Caudoviricetes sp.]